MTKKLLAILLAVIISLSVVIVPVAAAGVTLPNTSIENVFYMIVDKLLSWLLSYFNMYWPGYEDTWVDVDDYDSAQFYEGKAEFDNSVDESNEWSLGYAGESLLRGIDVLSGDYFLAGSLEPIAGRVPTVVYDDQRVRVYAISDGDDTDGDGVCDKVVHAVIDGFGFARGDLNIIRERLADFAEKNDIVSINVSVLHQHSVIDTLGMNVPLAPALIYNTSSAAVNGDTEKLVQKNKEFMENLFNKTTYAIKSAVKNMKTGDLYYGNIDAEEFIRDKRAPIAFDSLIHRLRFAPADGSAETWIIQAAIHATGLGAGPDELTADYPYYLEQYLKANEGVNVVYIQGAELAIAKNSVEPCTECGYVSVPVREDNGEVVRDGETNREMYVCEECGEEFVSVERSGYENLVCYGELLGKRVAEIGDDEMLEPILNIAHKEVQLSVTNEILTLASREKVINAVIANKTGADGKKSAVMITEIGYMELGDNAVAVFMLPGEFDPTIVFGGAESGSAAWMGKDWEYLDPATDSMTGAALTDYTGCAHAMAFGLCNDQAGYVLKDNEYHSIIGENEEVNVVSTTAASTFATSFVSLIDSVK